MGKGDWMRGRRRVKGVRRDRLSDTFSIVGAKHTPMSLGFILLTYNNMCVCL